MCVCVIIQRRGVWKFREIYLIFLLHNIYRFGVILNSVRDAPLALFEVEQTLLDETILFFHSFLESTRRNKERGGRGMGVWKYIARRV